ncbi:MAG: tyrosine-type recombinase/integrase [Bifidobacteriaceae bacterium]|jgi:integrase|nr:tyrosine-type recombinase/integrase [Bifidobacteriaceae bacterium]
MSGAPGAAPGGARTALFDEFVDHKRAVGYAYTGATAELVGQLSRFLDGYEPVPEVLSKGMVEDFCSPRPGEAVATRNRRISMVRQFALFLDSRGHPCHVPPAGTEAEPRFIPYIITEDEMARIIARAEERPTRRLSAAATLVYPMLLRMLWCCGLRLSEALGLRLADVDLGEGVLTIRRAKHNRTRLVPMSESLTAHARSYAEAMGLAAQDPAAFFYPGSTGGRRGRGGVLKHVKALMRRAGVAKPGGGTPRVHDFRHSHALAALRKMDAEGVDVYCSLPLLATYLGHHDITSTEYYLRLTTPAWDHVAQTMEPVYQDVFPEAV